MDVFVATTNAGKLRELRAIFAGYGWHADASAAYADVAEGDASYAENAALKARALAAAGVRRAVVGDDSGLEVAALGGRPGVRSARYGGEGATWPERRAALLAEMRGVRDRRARFVCALHLIDERGLAHAVEADLPGTLAEVERGDGGFSYDAIFVPYASEETFAEVPEARKNAISHRARAVRLLVEAVERGAEKGSAGGM